MGTTTNLQIPFPESEDTADVPRDMEAMAQRLEVLGAVPVGAFMMWLAANAPPAWLLMNGQQVSAATYPGLATVLGQAGGMVTIPDMRNFFPAGSGNVPLGQTAGAATVALSTNEMPWHGHGVADPGHFHITDVRGGHGHGLNISSEYVINPAYALAMAGGVTFGQVAQGNWLNAPHSTAANWQGANGLHAHSGNTDIQGDHQHQTDGRFTGLGINGTGGGAAHENRPPLRAVNFIIKAG